MTLPAPVDPLRRRLFLVLHDPFTGRPVVRGASVGCGLLSAVIAELLLAGRARSAGEVGPRMLAREIDASAPPPARAGDLPALAHRAVARDLVADGVLRHEPGPRLLGRARPRYPAVDLVRAVRPRRHLERALASRRPLDAPDAVLLALLVALGATRALDVDGGATALRARIGHLTEALPPALRDLAAGVGHADAGAVPVLRR